MTLSDLERCFNSKSHTSENIAQISYDVLTNKLAKLMLTRKTCNHIDLQTHAGSMLSKPVTLTFDLRVSACPECTKDYMSSIFGVDS